MCLLIVALGFDPEHPILAASNRDEARDRKAAPPGLFVGEHNRMLSPRDRRAGGTWLAVNDVGMLAGLTNVATGGASPPVDTSRGVLPHLALDIGRDADDGVGVAVARLRDELDQRAYAPFQLLVADRHRLAVVRWLADGTPLAVTERHAPTLAVISNEHALDELVVPGLVDAFGGPGDADARLERVRPLLLDATGERTGHRVLKRGGAWGTVSSSLIALAPDDPRALVWRYAPGPPDETDYRNYSNLARRLVEA